MKVTLQNNRWVSLSAIFYITLSIVLVILRLNKIRQGEILYYAVHTIVEIAYLIPIIYLLALLRFANEKKSVRTAFLILIIVEIFTFLIGQVPLHYLTEIIIYTIIGSIIYLVDIYVVVMILKIKHPMLARPFKIYAAALIIIVLLDLGVGLLLPLVYQGNTFLYSPYLQFIEPLPMVAILYIIYKSNHLIKGITPIPAQ